jgi:hypothetical protein
MQSKKKSAGSKKNPPKKKLHKVSNDHFNTVLTTQRTFVTVEETYNIPENKNSARTTQNSSRRECMDRMEANKLSPFSSPSKSVSPRWSEAGVVVK